jgi:hypothetical protein
MYTNRLKRIVKTPKLHFLDFGLLATARGLSFERVKGDRDVADLVPFGNRLAAVPLASLWG